MARPSFWNLSALFRRKEVKAREKIDQTFQLKSRVRPTGSVASEDVFTVYEVDFDGALIMNDAGTVTRVNWLTTDGRLRPDFADRWELVTETMPREAVEGRFNERYLAALR